jgi:hypothetical protein
MLQFSCDGLYYKFGKTNKESVGLSIYGAPLSGERKTVHEEKIRRNSIILSLVIRQKML